MRYPNCYEIYEDKANQNKPKKRTIQVCSSKHGINSNKYQELDKKAIPESIDEEDHEIYNSDDCKEQSCENVQNDFESGWNRPNERIENNNEDSTLIIYIQDAESKQAENANQNESDDEDESVTKSIYEIKSVNGVKNINDVENIDKVKNTNDAENINEVENSNEAKNSNEVKNANETEHLYEVENINKMQKKLSYRWNEK